MKRSLVYYKIRYHKAINITVKSIKSTDWIFEDSFTNTDRKTFENSVYIMKKAENVSVLRFSVLISIPGRQSNVLGSKQFTLWYFILHLKKQNALNRVVIFLWKNFIYAMPETLVFCLRHLYSLFGDRSGVSLVEAVFKTIFHSQLSFYKKR